ncbi:hypothetical protein [Streptomyces arenae]|uniref:PIN-like domain-containing protein n=1 Tax=Streptomyces arenae TaxID=29301 RepID=UPI00265AA31C|nr:hypothetical protein [Streptomyces arenae]MCG7203780.1 hypothetical protein [Streptomyces arenae]
MAEGLRACGWTVHRIGDAFPADGQNMPDEEWIAYGLDRSWVPLSKDGRIKTRDLEIQPVLEREAVLFYLDNQHGTRSTGPSRKAVRRRTRCGVTVSSAPGPDRGQLFQLSSYGSDGAGMGLACVTVR